MAAVNLERGGTEGGFFPQVGTNLDAPISAKKLVRSARKKTPEKTEQGQQTSSALELLKSNSSPKETMTEALSRISPKALTPEQKGIIANPFRFVTRNVQRGAAALGLIDPPEDPRARQKLLVTPGGTPGLPA